MKGKLKNNKGFTMMEIIIVIAMIAILVGISIVGINSYEDGAEDDINSWKAEVLYLATQAAIIDDYQNGTDIIPMSVTGSNPIELGIDIPSLEPAGQAIVANTGDASEFGHGFITKIVRDSKATTQITEFQWTDPEGNAITIKPDAGGVVEDKYYDDFKNFVYYGRGETADVVNTGTSPGLSLAEGNLKLFNAIGEGSFQKLTTDDLEAVGIETSTNLYWRVRGNVKIGSEAQHIFYAVPYSSPNDSNAGNYTDGLTGAKNVYMLTVGDNIYSRVGHKTGADLSGATNAELAVLKDGVSFDNIDELEEVLTLLGFTRLK